MTKVALINGQFFDSDMKKIRNDKAILIENGMISQLEDMACINSKITNEYKVYDLHGKYIFPGLINAHVHLVGSGKPMKALSGGKAQDSIVRLLKTRIGAKILDKVIEKHAYSELLSGVTTIRGVGDLLFSDIRLRNRIEKKQCEGPRILVSGPVISVTGGHGAGSLAYIEDSPWEARKLVRQNVYEQVDLIKLCVTGGITDSKKIGEFGQLKMTLEEIEAVCEEAHKGGLKVAAHAESIEGVRLALKGGVDTIEHGSMMDDEILDLFLHNPKSLNGYSCFIPTLYSTIAMARLKKEDTLISEISVKNSEMVFQGMVRGISQAKEAGVLIGMGTDASCSFVTQYNTWRELDYMIRFAKFSPQEAIISATWNNAVILGIENITGKIEIGKAADLVVTEKNPLEQIDAFKQICMILCSDRIYKDPRPQKMNAIDKLLDTI